MVAGIGFTMAIFIAGLAFSDPSFLATAKLAVLVASAAAGVLALLAGRLVLPAQEATSTVTPTDAESSTEH
jgi:NhaA family Na+:H+ antiporter